jgi:hypothetical protein
MTFTRVFTQLKRKEKQCMDFKFHSIREKLNENGEESYKIQLMRCLFFKKTDVKAGKEEKLTH